MEDEVLQMSWKFETELSFIILGTKQEDLLFALPLTSPVPCVYKYTWEGKNLAPSSMSSIYL